MSKFFTILYCTYLLLVSGTVMASDFAKEKRWADQIVDYLIDGEVEWLNTGKHKILAIYTEAVTETPKGSVIVIHGSGAHPNWSDVIHPVRTRLPEVGWNTLSIQMPVLSNDAEYTEYAPLFEEIKPRINAAIKNLKAKGSNKIMIVAHSLGTTMTTYYLASTKNHPVNAFIAIGMPGKSNDSRMNNVLSLKQVNIPVLDLYGSKDLKSVLDSTTERSEASLHNSKYSQLEIKDANHFFNNKNSELLEAVIHWLNKQ